MKTGSKAFDFQKMFETCHELCFTANYVSEFSEFASLAHKNSERL